MTRARQCFITYLEEKMISVRTQAIHNRYSHRSSYLNRYSRHADEGLVEVLDRLNSVIFRLVPDISYPSVWYELCVSDGVLCCEMFPEVAIAQRRGETSHEDAGGGHGGGHPKISEH